MKQCINLTGFILRQRVFTENDLIITLFNSEGEHIECVAKGAGSPKSKRRAHLEIGNLISATLNKGRTHWYLQSPRCEQSFSTLKTELEKNLKMQVLLEVILKAVHPEDPHPEIYEILLDTIQSMNTKGSHPFTAESGLIRITHELGFLPSFKECHHCHKHLPEDNANWNRTSASLSCEDCHAHGQKLPLKFRKAIEFLRMANQSQVSKLHINADDQIKLSSFITQFLLTHFKGGLKTLEFMSL